MDESSTISLMVSPSNSTAPSTALVSATPVASDTSQEGRNSNIAVTAAVTVVVVALVTVSAVVIILLVCLYKKKTCKQGTLYVVE